MKKASILSISAIGALILSGIMFSACTPEGDLCGDVNSSTVWDNHTSGDRADYIINCVVTVNADLTIEPGVTVEFGSEGGIIVESGGSITAVGTDVDPITFRGVDRVNGSWKGIYIKSNNVNNLFSYFQISDGGSQSLDGIAENKADIRVASNAQIRIDHSSIDKSGQDGLRIDGLDFDNQPVIMAFANNSFNDNTNYPITTTSASVKNLDGTNSTFTGNGKNLVDIRGGVSLGDNTWKKMNVNYHVSAPISIGSYSDVGNLTVEAGTTFQFAANQGICVGEYSSGYINMSGTSAAHITLTGDDAVAGSWMGICFQSTNASNKLDYVDISYGGSSSFTGATDKKANINMAGYSLGNATITNCNINNSGAWGILAGLGSPYTTPDASNSFSSNASGDFQHD